MLRLERGKGTARIRTEECNTADHFNVASGKNGSMRACARRDGSCHTPRAHDLEITVPVEEGDGERLEGN